MIFSMKYLSVAKQILGMKIIKNRKKRELKLSHQTYIENMLNSFSMKDAKEVSTPYQIISNYFPTSMWQASYYPIPVG